MKAFYLIALLSLAFVPTQSWGQVEVIKSNRSKPQVFKSSNSDQAEKIVRADNPKKRNLPEQKEEVQEEQTDTTVYWNKELKSELGQIKNSKSATIYKVESFMSSDSIGDYLEGFKVLDTATLTKESFLTIQSLIVDTSAYDLNEGQKLCLFLPKMGIVFQNEDGSTNVLVALDCDMTRIYGKNGYLLLNSDPSHQALQEIYDTHFPPTEMEMKMEVPTPVFYTVEDGDGWIRVAQKASNTYNKEISVTEILKWNETTMQKLLHPGDKIIVGFNND